MLTKNKAVHNQVLRGQFGKMWIDGEEYLNVKSFEAKISLKYETIDVNGEMGEHQRLIGYSIAGTMVLHKINSKIVHKLAANVKNGSLPEVKIVAKVTDPDVAGAERIELLDVTFDEMAFKFENKKVGEESVPFKVADYNYLDYIL